MMRLDTACAKKPEFTYNRFHKQVRIPPIGSGFSIHVIAFPK